MLAKFPKATISFIVSFCLFILLSVRLSLRPFFQLSVCPHETTPRDAFSRCLLFHYFSNFYQECSRFIWKSDKNNVYFTWRPIHNIIYYFAQFLLEWENFQTQVFRGTQAHILLSDFFQKSYRFFYNCLKFYRDGQATDDNVVHAHFMLDTNTLSKYIILILFYCNNGWINAP